MVVKVVSGVCQIIDIKWYAFNFKSEEGSVGRPKFSPRSIVDQTCKHRCETSVKQQDSWAVLLARESIGQVEFGESHDPVGDSGIICNRLVSKRSCKRDLRDLARLYEALIYFRDLIYVHWHATR